MPEDEALRPRRPRRRPGAQRSATAPAGPTGSSCSTAGGSGTRSQGCWMGWERKRGKLSEFNRLLRGDRDTSYTVAAAATRRDCRAIRFVITLDADTQMPRDTAGRLVGTLAHPLNRPRFDPATGRVVEGYGVLQPRVSFHLTAATHSRFAALLAASGGIDPYSTAASDAYMDLFGLGSFTGKGIYDVDAFEAATGKTFPENQHPQPRPDRGELRPLRPGQRHRAVRRLPGPLPRLRPPRAPLGPRRLAAPALAGPARADARRASLPASRHRRRPRHPRGSRGAPLSEPSSLSARREARPRGAPLRRIRLAGRLALAEHCHRPPGPPQQSAARAGAWKLLDNLRRSLVPPALPAAAGARLDRATRLAVGLDGGGVSWSSCCP